MADDLLLEATAAPPKAPEKKPEKKPRTLDLPFTPMPRQVAAEFRETRTARPAPLFSGPHDRAITHPALRSRMLAGERQSTQDGPDESALFDAAGPTEAPRALPAAATIYNPTTKKDNRVTLNSKVPGLSGYIVGDIDPHRGVLVVADEGLDQPDYWIPPTSGEATPTATRRPRRQADARSDDDLLKQAAGFSVASDAGPVGGGLDETDTPETTAAIYEDALRDMISGPMRRIMEARIYERRSIPYKAPNEAALADMVTADFAEMTQLDEVSNWQDTGYTLYTMKNRDGEQRSFLVSEDSDEFINITDWPGLKGSR